MERRVRVAGSLGAAEVWERYVRPGSWAGWAPQIREVDTAAARIAPGVTGWVRGPLGVRVGFTVVEVDEPGRTWAWDVRLGPIRLHLRHGVEAAGAGCATWLTVRGPAPVVTAYLPVARFALRRLVRG